MRLVAASSVVVASLQGEASLEVAIMVTKLSWKQYRIPSGLTG